MKKLALLGLGGNNADVLDAVNAHNAIRPSYEVIGYFGKPVTAPESSGHAIPCLGGREKACKLPAEIMVAGFVGSGIETYHECEQILDAIGLPADRYATIVHPGACVPPPTVLGHGIIILAGAVLCANVKMGNWVRVLQNATLSHGCVVGHYSCITSAAALAGSVKVGRSCYIGTNATIVPGVKIGEKSLIGAGALIRHDVPAGEVWAGNPGRRLYSLEDWLAEREKRRK